MKFHVNLTLEEKQKLKMLADKNNCTMSEIIKDDIKTSTDYAKTLKTRQQIMVRNQQKFNDLFLLMYAYHTPERIINMAKDIMEGEQQAWEV